MSRDLSLYLTDIINTELKPFQDCVALILQNEAL